MVIEDYSLMPNKLVILKEIRTYPQQNHTFKGMQVFRCNDEKVDRSSKSEFIFHGTVSYFPNRSETSAIRWKRLYVFIISNMTRANISCKYDSKINEIYTRYKNL